MFGSPMQSQELPMIIVADEKDMVYANYLIQLIGQKDDAGDSIVGIEDDSLSAAIYTPKIYKDNLSQIPSSQHILFIGDQGSCRAKDHPDSSISSACTTDGRQARRAQDDTHEWLKLKDNKGTTRSSGSSASRAACLICALQFAQKLDGIVKQIMPAAVAAPRC